MLPFIAETIAFLGGLLLGSFLNVLISRLPRGESIVTPRSHCPSCNTPIRWYDNIPLLSWILLRARCRSCRQAIPWRYPAVELATGLWFLLITAQALGRYSRLHRLLPALGDADAILAISAVSLLTLGLFLIALIVIDWQTQTLPNTLTWPGILTGLFLVCTHAIFLGPAEGQIHLTRNPRISSPGSLSAHGTLFLTGPEALIFGRIAAAVLAAAILLLIRWLYRRLRHREGMGLGDVRLLALVAAFLGFWPAILALFLGLLLATAYASSLLARRRAHALTRLPFGSFLGLGGLLSALFGQPLIAWYKTLL